MNESEEEICEAESMMDNFFSTLSLEDGHGRYDLMGLRQTV